MDRPAVHPLSENAGISAANGVLLLGCGNDDKIPQAEAGLCRRCGPDLDAAGGKALQIVRGIWPAMAGYEVSVS